MKVISENNPEAVDLAVKVLRAGKAISFATDTVYGVAVDASNQKAVELLYTLKKRDPKKPIAIFLQDIASAQEVFYFDEVSQKIASNFLPGKLTLVLKQRSEGNTKIATNLNYDAQNFLGFRIVECEFIRKMMEKFGGILAVTSANPAGAAPATDAGEVKKYFANSDLDLIIDGGKLISKNVSTVVRVADRKIEILRQGAISESLINQYKI